MLNRHVCQVTKDSELRLIRAPAAAKDAVALACALMVSVDLRPLNIVSGPGFKALAQKLVLVGSQYGQVEIDSLLSDPKTIRGHVHELAEEERASLYPRVIAAANAGELACTVDSWTEDTKRYGVMCCNVMFPSFNTKTNEWEIETKVYFTKTFPAKLSKNSENQQKFIFDCFVERGVPRDKLTGICFVTDGEAALKKALNDCQREYCLAHAYNIVYTHAVTVTPNDFASLPQEAIATVATVREIIENCKKLRNSKVGKKLLALEKVKFPKTYTDLNCCNFVQINFNKIRRMMTAVKKADCLKALQMENVKLLIKYLSELEAAVGRKGHVSGAALDGVTKLCQDTESDTGFMLSLRAHLRGNECIEILKFNKLKESCSSLVTYMKSSGRMGELSKTLKQYMEVRWNSSFTMFQSVLDVYDELEALLGQERLAGVPKALLEEVIGLLKPLRDETEAIQAKKTVTSSLVLPSFHILRRAFSPKGSDCRTVEVLRSRLARELPQVVKLTDTHSIATFLDPRFRTFKNMLSPQERDEVYEKVRRLIADFEVEDGGDDPGEGPDQAAAAQAPSTSTDKYADFQDDVGGVPGDEVQAYLEEPLGVFNGNPLSWWSGRASKFPRLFRLVRKYLIIPATSAESERTFSDAGWILNSRRKSVERDLLADLLLLHGNCREKLLEKLIALQGQFVGPEGTTANSKRRRTN